MTFSRTGAWALIPLAAFVVLAACSNTEDFAGVEPSIPAGKEVITFQVAGDEDVVFTHEAHAEYWEQNCFECHTHTDVRDESIWSCGECHSADDSEGLCTDLSNGHDCMSVQCFSCHDQQIPDPAPLCADCHMIFTTGTFFDAVVEGLGYQTLTRNNVTDQSGYFQYRPGETIRFSVGSVVLGTSRARSVMTPVDLVPGAVDESDPTVTNIARFLQTLDENGYVWDGIVVLPVVHDAAIGRAISFTVSTAAFGGQPDLGALIADLNSGIHGTVFTDGPHTLVTSTAARSNLGWVLDNEVSAASPTRVMGAPNTNFVLIASHDTSGGGDYIYQWYRSNTEFGLRTPISGATAATYHPVSGDLTRYLSFDVTPAVGSTPSGTTTISASVGPVTAGTSVVALGAIDSASQVDHYIFRLTSTSDVTIDVMSWEMVGGGCCGVTDIFGNGAGNDALISNIWLFEADSTPIFGRTGYAPFYSWQSKYGGRAKKNPFEIVNGLPAGEYLLAIGATLLGEADAWAGVNSDGTSWSTIHPILGPPYPNYNNYKVTFTFD